MVFSTERLFVRMDRLEGIVRNFLFAHCTRKKKPSLLLGYSGGVDSKTLLYLLLSCREEFDFSLHLAHVDHGWRKKSAYEAKLLEEEAKRLKLPFHKKKLVLPQKRTNLEAVCRIERFSFFQKLKEKFSFSALLLAHHADDQAETILKRFFEGGNLQAMEPVTELYQMVIWRPLLSVRKEELLSYLNKKSILPFFDPANREEKYLRSRMRERMVPFLTHHFGKEIVDNICLVSKRAKRIAGYLDKKTEKIFAARVDGPVATFLDLSPFQKMEKIELEHLIKRLVKQREIVLSRNNIDRIIEAIQDKKVSFSLTFRGGTIFFERNILFLLISSIPPPSPLLLKKEGKYQMGIFEITCQKSLFFQENRSWKDLLEGKPLSLFLEKKKYLLSLPKRGEYLGRDKRSKILSQEKIPSFLRFSLPVAYQEEKMAGDFLVPNKPVMEENVVRGWKISLSFSSK